MADTFELLFNSKEPPPIQEELRLADFIEQSKCWQQNKDFKTKVVKFATKSPIVMLVLKKKGLFKNYKLPYYVMAPIISYIGSKKTESMANIFKLLIQVGIVLSLFKGANADVNVTKTAAGLFIKQRVYTSAVQLVTEKCDMGIFSDLPNEIKMVRASTEKLLKFAVENEFCYNKEVTPPNLNKILHDINVNRIAILKPFEEPKNDNSIYELVLWPEGKGLRCTVQFTDFAQRLFYSDAPVEARLYSNSLIWYYYYNIKNLNNYAEKMSKLFTLNNEECLSMGRVSKNIVGKIKFKAESVLQCALACESLNFRFNHKNVPKLTNYDDYYHNQSCEAYAYDAHTKTCRNIPKFTNQMFADIKKCNHVTCMSFVGKVGCQYRKFKETKPYVLFDNKLLDAREFCDNRAQRINVQSPMYICLDRYKFLNNSLNLIELKYQLMLQKFEEYNTIPKILKREKRAVLSSIFNIASMVAKNAFKLGLTNLMSFRTNKYEKDIIQSIKIALKRSNLLKSKVYHEKTGILSLKNKLPKISGFDSLKVNPKQVLQVLELKLIKLQDYILNLLTDSKPVRIETANAIQNKSTILISQLVKTSVYRSFIVVHNQVLKNQSLLTFVPTSKKYFNDERFFQKSIINETNSFNPEYTCIMQLISSEIDNDTCQKVMSKREYLAPNVYSLTSSLSEHYKTFIMNEKGVFIITCLQKQYVQISLGFLVCLISTGCSVKTSKQSVFLPDGQYNSVEQFRVILNLKYSLKMEKTEMKLENNTDDIQNYVIFAVIGCSLCLFTIIFIVISKIFKEIKYNNNKSTLQISGTYIAPNITE